MESFINFLSNKFGTPIQNFKPVSTGDVSQAFLINTKIRDYFLKISTNTNGLAMFRAEQNGLKAIARTKTIKTPKIIDCYKFEQYAYLLLEYIPSKQPSDKNFENFGHQLAKLHLSTNDEFGFNTDNFIGNLDQSNNRYIDWVRFYTKERLMPQFKLALKNNLLNIEEIPSEALTIEVIDTFCGKIKPSLLHGDLWSGNYLISMNDEPYLIDSAVYYGHNEVDIAMTRLFGGFTSSFYKSYHDVIPKTKHYNECTSLYQLYYLLVHLNLFGGSYYKSVVTILRAYF